MKYKTVFISDVHLGTDICQYEKLLSFLKDLETDDGNSYNVENLYLVGDIIDMTNINHKVFWRYHRTVIKKLLRMADKGVKITYIPGNHDYHLRREIFEDKDLRDEIQDISFRDEVIYETAKGKKYLVLHGDQFDGAVRMHPWLYKMGDWLYQFVIFLSKWQNRIRRLFGGKEWSMSLWLKTKTKQAVSFVSKFDELITKEMQDKKCDGAIYGHTHFKKDITLNGYHILNTGCWTEYCSYVAEDMNGNLELHNYE